MSGIVIGARTGSEGGGGQYSVFYNAVPFGEAFSQEAWVDGLQQNEENRSNLAMVNTGEVDGEPERLPSRDLRRGDRIAGRDSGHQAGPGPGLASDQRHSGQLRPGDPARGISASRRCLGRIPSWPTEWSMTAGLRASGAVTEPICRQGSSPQSYEIPVECSLRSKFYPRASVRGEWRRYRLGNSKHASVLPKALYVNRNPTSTGRRTPSKHSTVQMRARFLARSALKFPNPPEDPLQHELAASPFPKSSLG